MRAAEVDGVLEGGGDLVAGLCALPEGQWFERKSGRIRARDLADALLAFANAEGGVIVVGLHDGRADPPSDDRANELRQAALDFTEPVVSVRTGEYSLGDGAGSLLVFRVAPGERVHQTRKGDCLLRVGDESKRLGFAQRQELEFDRGSAPFDGTAVPVPRAHLDESRMEEYRRVIGSSSIAAMLNARNLLTSAGEVTVAGYLLFGDHPQAHFPNAHVRVLRFAEPDRGVGSGLNLQEGGDVRCEGSIPQQITAAMQAVERLIPRRRRLTRAGRFEPVPIIPRDAWLEAVVNAVIHRSYAMAGDHVRVELFPDRVEVFSPGRFPGLVDPDDLPGIARHARNPRIARVCADLGIAQELGEGIRRMVEEVRRRGLVDPVYQQTQSGVRLILSAADAVPEHVLQGLSSGARRTHDALRVAARPLGTGQVEELVGVTRPTALRYLRALEASGLVVWDGQTAKDPRATWRAV